METSISEISTFSKEFDELWERNSNRSKVMVVRDRKYLDWRFINKPGKEYVAFKARSGGKTSGYIVLKITNDKSYIMDILTDDDHRIGRDLISYAVEHSRREGAKDMVFPFLDKGLTSIVSDLGFGRSKIGFHLMARSYDQEISQSLMGDKKNWYFSYGDIDHH